MKNWRRLDNSAKIFPLSTGKKYSTVFRLSVVLKEDVQPAILQEALIATLEKYQSFKVKIKKGFFWHYLENNAKIPIIEEETDYPCKYIDPALNKGYLFKVTYFKNKINIDIFHSLTDGNGGTVFFRELVYTYLEMCHSDELKSENRTIRKIDDYNTEDSYVKNYDKKSKSNGANPKAYKIKGKQLRLGAVSCIHQIINLEQLKTETKKYDATITQYLTAVLIYSIYKENYIKYNGKKPIKMYIPVNLKKYFPSKTMSNFFSYITLSSQANGMDLGSFEEILEFVKKEFKEQLTEKEIIKTMSNNVKLGTNFFIKIIPLVLKIMIVRLAYLEIRKHSTTTYSNIGRIGILGDYQKYIDYFLVAIAPDPFERMKCSSCTFENNMVFTFTSIINDNKIEQGFYRFLQEKGIEVKIESNGVLDDISTKIE
ncbi:MAG: hypothetical protein IJE59_00375 [Clostridia bacterium]|nr:hypothetical protein [Clostridia bacterium]